MTNGSASPYAPVPTRRTTIIAMVVIVALAFAVRIAFLIAYSPTEIPFADGFWYHHSANLLADGKGLIDPLAYVFRGHVRQSAGHPPLFVFVLGAASFLGGTSTLTHQIIELTLDVVAVGVIGLLAREVGGTRVGLIAGFFAALYPHFWATEGEVLSESLYAVTVALMLLLAYRFIRTPSWRVAAWLGVSVGLVALTRGEGLLFLGVLVVPLVWFHGRTGTARRALLLTAAVAGTFLIVAPWTIYNSTRFAKPVLVTTGLGTVIAGANCDVTYSAGELGHWDIGCSARGSGAGDESERSERLRRIGTDYAMDHLTRLPVVMAARVARLLEVYDPNPTTFGPEWVQALLLAGWYSAAALAIPGAIVLRRRGVALMPFGAAVAAVVVNAAITWGAPRFRVPIDITVVVLAAVAVDAALRHFTRRPRSVHHHLALGNDVVADAERS